MITPPALPRGLLPVVQLPYREDFSIDWDIYARELEWLLETGADGFVLAMVTEILRLTDAERRELLARTVQIAAGRVPVITSVGAESIPALCRRATEAEDDGAAALMATPPHLTPGSPDAILEYFRALLEATSLPIIVQDASGYLGRAIPVETLAHLNEEAPKRIAFKPEARPLTQNHARLMELTGGQAAVYEGSAGVGLFGGHHLGLAGTMPGADVSWAIRKLWDYLEAGDTDAAWPVHAALTALVAPIASLDEYLAVEKRLLLEMGIFKNTRIRPPVSFRLDPATEKLVLYCFRRLRGACGES